MFAKPQSRLFFLFTLLVLGLAVMPARAGTPTTITFTQQPGNAASGAVITPAVVVHIADAASNPVSGVSVVLTKKSGPGTITGLGTPTTDALGNVTFSTLTANLIGSYQLTATDAADGLAVDSTAFAVTSGATAALSFTQQPPAGAAFASGAAITPAYKVAAADAAGNPVAGAAVTLALTAGAGRLSGGATQLTDGTGAATFAGLSVDRSGAGKQLTATSGSAAPSLSNTFAVTAGTPTALSFTQQPGNAASGAIITPPVVVHVADAAGNPVPGVSVVLTKKSGPGTVGGTLSQTTDASGNATFGDLSANLVGGYQLTATDAADGLTVDSTAFAVTSGATAALSFTQQPPAGAAFASGAAITPAYKVAAADAAGNPVAGAAVTLALTAGAGRLSGGATQLTDGTGAATFAGLSVDRSGAGKQLTATSGSAAPSLSNTFAVTAGTPTALSFTQQPGNTSPNALITPVKVQALDAAGNPASGVPIVLVFSGNSSNITGTLTQNTDASGTATFADLRVNAAGTYQLTARDAADSLTVASSIFTITTGAAANIAFTTQPTSTTAGASITPPVVVKVTDGSSNPVPGIAVSLTKKSGPGTVGGTLNQTTDANGNATFGNLSANLAGTYQLTAAGAGLTPVDSTAFAITAGAAANIAFTAQPTGTTAGAAIAPPVVVKVTDTFGNAVAGAGVSVVLAPGSTGTLSGTSPRTTDAGGNATFNDLKINLAGVKQLTATSGSLIVNSTTFTVTAGTPTTITFTQQPTTTASGAVVAPPVVVHVADAAGNPAPGVSVALTKKSGPGTVGGTLSQTTDASGNATFGDLSANLVGGYQLTATDAADGLTVDSSAFSITTGPATQISFAQQPTSTASGAAITPPVVVHLQDAAGNPLPLVPVTLTLSGGPGALSGTITQVTDVGGNAIFPDLTVDRVGTTYTLTASGAGLTRASSQFAVTPAAAAAIAFTTQPSNTVAGRTLAPPVVVLVTDPAGNPVPGTIVSLSLSTGSSPGGTPTQTSDARGRATFGDLNIAGIGTYQIIATSSSLTPITSNAFAITAGTASTLVFTQQPTDTVSGADIAPPVVATLKDVNNNPVVGVRITLTKKSGPGTVGGTLNQTTDANGNATFGNLSANLAGAYQLTATGGGLTPIDSATFAIMPGAAAAITFTTPPTSTTAGAPIAPPVVAHLVDAGGNPVAGAAVVLALSGGPGTLGGTLTQVSDASGNATFGDLSVNRVGTTYVLRATSGIATPVTSSTFAITPGPGLLTFTVQPSGAASSAPIAPPVVVQFLDGTGNPIVGASVSLALPAGSAATLSGTSTQTTDASGSATFSNLSLDKVGTYQLTTASGSLTSLPSSAFTITTGPATQISFTQQPATGVHFGFGASLTPPAILVQVRDAANNPVVGSSVLLSLAVGAGPLNGSATQPTDTTGTASFSGLSITSPGSAQLKAVSGSLSALGNVFTIGDPTAAISGLSTNIGLVHAGDPAFILTIAGGGFAPGAVVTFNGQPSNAPANPQVTNVAVNSAGTQVTASIAASLVATAGSYGVIVTNSGTADSNSKPFLVLPLGPSADSSGAAPHPADSNLNAQYFDAGLQLISVPFDYTKDSTGKSLGVNDVLRVFNLTDPGLPAPSLSDLSDTETLGTLAVWNPAAAAYALTSPGSTAGLADQLVLGRGYWGRLRYQPLVPGIETGLKTRGLEAKDIANALNTQRQFPIALQAGWNMIGDPFTGPVNLRDLQVQNGSGNAFSLVDANNQALVSATLYRYSLTNGGMGYVALSPTKSDTLVPYVGYWVLAYQSCTLLVPSP